MKMHSTTADSPLVSLIFQPLGITPRFNFVVNNEDERFRNDRHISERPTITPIDTPGHIANILTQIRNELAVLPTIPPQYKSATGGCK